MGDRVFGPDSSIVPVAAPGRGYKRGKYQPRRSYSAIVVHTTGRGILKKAKRWGVSPIEAAARVYGAQMDAGAHYVICGLTGAAIQTCPEELAAWHVGSKGSKPYGRPNWARSTWWKRTRGKKVEWWSNRWPGFQSPHELAYGELWAPNAKGRPSCNANTIGIEVIPNAKHPSGVWTNAAWIKLIQLCQDIRWRRSIHFRRETILSHSDAHPLARTARNRPWDPPGEIWTYEEFAVRAGLPVVCGGTGS